VRCEAVILLRSTNEADNRAQFNVGGRSSVQIDFAAATVRDANPDGRSSGIVDGGRASDLARVLGALRRGTTAAHVSEIKRMDFPLAGCVHLRWGQDQDRGAAVSAVWSAGCCWTGNDAEGRVP